MIDHEPGALSRRELIELLNDDLAQEVRAVTSYASSARMLSGTENPRLGALLESYASAELSHALTLASQIDTLGGMPDIRQSHASMPVAAGDLVRAHVDDEAVSIEKYRLRVRQCEELGEHSLAESLRSILAQEQEQLAGLIMALADPDSMHPEPSFAIVNYHR